MASIEKDCKWYFPPLVEGVDEQNITSSDEETLNNQSSIEALVRESIQNSLDVHDQKCGKPVVVEFKFGTIQTPQETIPAFLEIEEHIKGAKEYIISRGIEKAGSFFDPMLSFMETHRESFPYLCVSDYNTIGMDYSPEGRSRFYSFMNNGFNDKNESGSGGSYGIGKAAYYMFSEIRTILISSMYKDKANNVQTVFKGSSKLTTHKFRGECLYNKGHYDKNKATPLTEASEIPEKFLRKKMGTSIFIMGIDDSINSKEETRRKIEESVIRNFWFAILDKKLEVIVDFEEDESAANIINYQKLKDVMPLYEPYDRKGEGYTNPRPYYEAVTTAVAYDPEGPIQQSVFFDNNHSVFGHARFYLVKNDQKHDRWIRMRSLRMFVSMEKVSGKRGFNGVLVCDDKWNELLTYAEPPAHNKWDKNRIKANKKINSETKKEAEVALDTITKWVNDCIATYFKEGQDNELDFYGIKDLLYTEKDLGSTSRHDGNSNSQEEGTPSNEEAEYGISTSKSLGVDGEKLVTIRPIASVTAIKQTKATPDKKGKLLGKKKKKRHVKPGPKVEHKPGTTFPVSPDKKGKEGKYREVYDVAVRCFIPSGQEDPHLYTMVINSKRKIEKAMVEITTGAAIDTIDVPVSFSDKGIFAENRIYDIPLEQGINVLHFKFNDKISHKVTTATYEFK